MPAPSAKAEDGLRLVAYPGDQKILLAISLADNAVNGTDKNLAGFVLLASSTVISA